MSGTIHNLTTHLDSDGHKAVLKRMDGSLNDEQVDRVVRRLRVLYDDAALDDHLAPVEHALCLIHRINLVFQPGTT
jgi:hypothetical protein